MKNRWIRYMMTAAACVVTTLSTWVCADAMTVKVDGDPSEWVNVSMIETKDQSIASKWAVTQDDENIYLYIQQNGGNEYWMPMFYQSILIAYTKKGAPEAKTAILFSQEKDLRDKTGSSVIDDSKVVYEPSDTKDKYDIECSIPKSFFYSDKFTLTFAGTSISSDKIPKASEIAGEETEAVYDGIVIDGSFSDWKAVIKTAVEDKKPLLETAMIMDGDYVYIYMKESSDKALTWSGKYNNGKFTILTDTGRNLTFKLNTDSIEGVSGAKVAHSNFKYEIAIPVSELPPYISTISYGYYMEEDMLIEGVANLKKDDNDKDDKKFQGIVYDGSYGDWDYYPHKLIEYSTPGSNGRADSEAALYLDDTTLYGHVRIASHSNRMKFQPFTLRFNGKKGKSLDICLVAVDKDGNINYDPKLSDLQIGKTYEFYLFDRQAGTDTKNIADKNVPIFGQMHYTPGASSDETEYKVDLEKVAEYLHMNVTDMKLIEANYVNIGDEWVSIAGTSTGPLLGMSLCGLSVLAVFGYRRRKNKVKA